MGPLVSVIIPAYNVSRFIEATIRSVLAQTYTNWELIIINDGSKDRTEELILPFLADKRIQLHSQKNSGVAVSRNNGLKIAKGEFIALLDADDLMLPENLSKKIEMLNRNPEADWAYSNQHLINENGEPAGPDTNGKKENLLENLLLWNGEVIPAPCSNLVFRNKILKDGVLFDPAFSTAADQDFVFRLASRYKPVFSAEPLAAYRLVTNSMSRNIALMEKDHIAVYQKAAAGNLFHSSRFRRKCFSNLYLILAGSWWVNGKNKMRGLQFMLKAVLIYPPAAGKLIRKFF